MLNTVAETEQSRF